MRRIVAAGAMLLTAPVRRLAWALGVDGNAVRIVVCETLFSHFGVRFVNMLSWRFSEHF